MVWVLLARLLLEGKTCELLLMITMRWERIMLEKKNRGIEAKGKKYYFKKKFSIISLFTTRVWSVGTFYYIYLEDRLEKWER